jgi:hypothetical protein
MQPAAGAILNLDQISQNLQSTNEETRARAMQALLLGVQKDPSLRPAALPIFQNAILTEQDPSTAVFAARGIEVAGGPTEARKAWLELFLRPEPKIVERAATAVHDPYFATILTELVEHRTESAIRIAALRTLGRLRDSSALPSMLNALTIPELWPHAVEALGELGDTHAIPYLAPLLEDRTEAWPIDNHGPMLHVSDLAREAITRLRATAAPAPPQTFTAGHQPPPVQSARPKVNVAAYMPLMATVAELPWIAAIVIGTLCLTGKFEPDQATTRRFDLLAMIPALLGLGIGILVLFRGGLHRWFDRIFLLLGCAACCAFIFSFGWELIH